MTFGELIKVAEIAPKDIETFTLCGIGKYRDIWGDDRMKYTDYAVESLLLFSGKWRIMVNDKEETT